VAAKLTPWAFVLAVQDLDKSAAYFRDVLGFTIGWTEGQDWRLAERDGVRLMIGHCPADKLASEIGSHSWFGYIEVADVDAFHRELTGRGADCTPPHDQPYGMREIVVTTPDGHRIVFASEKKKSA
jgi:catechol 2,3-dioxygenase-like lactoylglutathione lyase family enzyme